MSMFCFQCEQTVKTAYCTSAGICGKNAETANLQDTLTGELIALVRAAECVTPNANTHKLVINSLFMAVTNVNFDNASIARQIQRVTKEKARLLSLCDNSGQARPQSDAFDLAHIWQENEDMRSLKSLLLFGLRGMAAYAHHAALLGKSDDTVNRFFYKALLAIAGEHSADELLALVLELGHVNLTCMALLDTANTGAYGNPTPTKVSCTIEPGPFIVVSGHDLRDLKLLLEQTEGQGVNVYTHCEMLPAHSYPELKKYPHLKGNFGTAWQNQQREFEDIPAPVLFTTNCIMPVPFSYADRVYTTSVVSYPGMEHISAEKDFTVLIEKAYELGGYTKPHKLTGINGGDTLTTGFGRNAVLSCADKIIEGLKSGAIKHLFLVGGCDGAKPGRNYYTEFVKQAPKDTVILTLACGKYRFNDLDLGEICGLPRIMDMGQCNDAYSAITVALALSKALDCSVNDLPLTLVLSWYEQKAVCILLTLLALGIKNIYIGPTLPAFVPPNTLTPISTPEADLRKILGKRCAVV